jgi:hypothetical protein
MGDRSSATQSRGLIGKPASFAYALYEVVRDNIETLYGAVSDGALAVRIPKHARKELEAYLACGLLCHGFARFRCPDCGESRLVAFSCKSRGFCPSCMGRRMNATAANLIERVLPEDASLRQWVLTFPFAWRPSLARDGALVGSLTRIFEATVQGFYARRARQEGHLGGKTGSITVVQRTSSDLRLNPHLHAVFLDGAWHEQEGELFFGDSGISGRARSARRRRPQRCRDEPRRFRGLGSGAAARRRLPSARPFDRRTHPRESERTSPATRPP